LLRQSIACLEAQNKRYSSRVQQSSIHGLSPMLKIHKGIQHGVCPGQTESTEAHLETLKQPGVQDRDRRDSWQQRWDLGRSSDEDRPHEQAGL
jgi:hypothetical protein